MMFSEYLYIDLPDGWYDLVGDGNTITPDFRLGIFSAHEERFPYSVKICNKYIIALDCHRAIEAEKYYIPSRFYHTERIYAGIKKWGRPLQTLIKNENQDFWKTDLVIEV